MVLILVTAGPGLTERLKSKFVGRDGVDMLSFDEWVELYSKNIVYNRNDEDLYNYRKDVYEQNIFRWKEMNQIDGGATYGPDREPFSDLTPSEFSMLLGNLNCYRTTEISDSDSVTEIASAILYDRLLLPKARSFGFRTLLETLTSTISPAAVTKTVTSDRITYIDWRNHNGQSYVTPPKNQGRHGTCWSFAASENLEGLNVRQGYPLVNISEQEFISCCEECQGRTQEVTFEWLVNTTGGRPALEESYPYDGNTNVTCRAKDAPRANVTLHYWDRIVDDEEGSGMNILLGLTAKGPMSMGVDARCFFGYQSGVIRNCSHVPDGERARNHAVSLVAAGADIYRYEREDGLVDTEMLNYFTIKNR